MPLEGWTITPDQIASNTTDHLMICLLIDSSYSMSEYHRMDMVNEGVKNFIESAKNNPKTCDGIDLCIITFGGAKPAVLTEFTNIKYVQFSDIKPDGGTHLAQAIDFAIDRIKKYKNFLSSIGTVTWLPWLIILSDGKSDDNISSQAFKLQQLYKKHQLKGECVGIGDKAELAELSRLSPDGSVRKIDDFSMNISKYFDMLSRSVEAIGLSEPDLEDSDGKITG